jgi:hypothetical protein
MEVLLYFFILTCSSFVISNAADQFKIWGPALEANKITLPAQYFFIQDLRNR